MNIDLNVRELFGIKGKWDVAFTVSKEEISKNMVEFDVNQKVNLDDNSITIDKVSLSPINTTIVVSGKYDNTNTDYIDHSYFEYENWFVFDDNGNYLKDTGGSGHSDGSKFHQIYYLEPLDKASKYLTIIPCEHIPSAQGGIIDGKPIETKEFKIIETVKPLKGDYPIELEQGIFGKLVIEDVRTEKDKTIVTFYVQGIAPPFQAEHLEIRDKNGEYVMRKGSPKIIEKQKDNYKFLLEFDPLKDDKNYNFFTTTFNNYKLREDLKFNIQLQK